MIFSQIAGCLNFAVRGREHITTFQLTKETFINYRDLIRVFINYLDLIRVFSPQLTRSASNPSLVIDDSFKYVGGTRDQRQRNIFILYKTICIFSQNRQETINNNNNTFQSLIERCLQLDLRPFTVIEYEWMIAGNYKSRI